MRASSLYREGMSFDEYMSVVPNRFQISEENVMGLILEQDLSDKHVEEDPLIKNFAEANHFLDYNYSKASTRAYLRVKFFFKSLFSRRPKRKKN